MPRPRSPRQKTVLIFLVSILCIVIIVSSLAYYLILGSFAGLEEEESRNDMMVIRNTITEQAETLHRSVRLLGANDDSYQFLSDNSSLLADITAGNKKFDELQLNFLIIYNRTGEVYFSKGYDLTTARDITVPPGVSWFFQRNGMFNSSNFTDSTSDIVRMEDTAMLVAASPITTKDGTGLSRGTIVIGRYVNDLYIQKLSDLTGRPLEIGFVGDAEMTDDMRDAEYAFKGASPPLIYVNPITSTQIASYTQINDVTGTPTLILKTERSRDIFARGLAAVEVFMIILVVTISVFVFFGLRLINKAFAQIDHNIEQFAILGDHIRNPLTIIVGLADLHETSISRKIIEQAKIIDEIVTKLDSGWIESEKIKDFLRKYSHR
jgi:sensor domain CHASE-containing protein